MKSLSRITALAVLLFAAVLGRLVGGTATPRFPFLHPASPERLREQGILRFSISRDLMDTVPGSFRSLDFDYDLLSRFASELGVSLAERVTASNRESAQLLRSGMVDVALLSSGFDGAPDLVISDPCVADESQPPSRLSLALRPDSPGLVALLSGAALRIAEADESEALYEAYCRYRPPDHTPERAVPLAGRIFRYAPVIAKYAGEAGFDWRLVAALIFEESSFEEKAVSPKGAQGLMQLMPTTSAEVGATNVLAAEANIQAGVLYLRRLSDQFTDAHPEDRLAMALAAYLLGPGHVVDAQDLARDLGLDAQSWHQGLEQTLPLLDDERFNRRTRLGYAHGRQALEYVNRILERYELYQHELALNPDVRADDA